jgi:hypothetical protein
MYMSHTFRATLVALTTDGPTVLLPTKLCEGEIRGASVKVGVCFYVRVVGLVGVEDVHARGR